MDDPTPGHHSLRSTLPGLEGLSDDKARAFTRLLTSQGLVHGVIESQQAAVVRDSLDDPRWMPGPGTDPALSILIAPLRSQTGFVACAGQPIPCPAHSAKTRSP
jgi:hypothetical protein